MNNPKISVVTVCYNAASCLEETILSVINQSYDNIEYIIIDGKSTDGSLDIIDKYADRISRCVSEPDNGIYDAMNKGIRKSTGEIVGIINSGDWYEYTALSTVANSYKMKHFDMFYADINLVKPNGSIIVKHSKPDKIVTSRHWNHPTSFVTKKVYNELGGFRCKGIHDDFEFLLRVKKANKKIAIRNVVLANFMVGGTSNQKSLRKSIGRIKDRYNAYRINGYSPLYIIECVGIEVAKAILS